MESKQKIVAQLSRQAIRLGGFMEMDIQFVYNQLSRFLALEEPLKQGTLQKADLGAPEAIPLADLFAQYNQLSGEESLTKKMKDQIIEFITPPPSVINALFAQKYAEDPVAALNYFEQLMVELGVTKVFGEEEGARLPEINGFGKEGQEKQVPAGYRFIRLNLANQSWGLAVPPLLANSKEFLVFPEASPAELAAEDVANALFSLSEVFPTMSVVGTTLPETGTLGQKLRLEEFDQTVAEVEAAYMLPAQPTLFPEVFFAEAKERAQTFLLTSQRHDILVKAFRFLQALTKKAGLSFVIQARPECIQVECQLGALVTGTRKTAQGKETSFDEINEVWQNLISQLISEPLKR